MQSVSKWPDGKSARGRVISPSEEPHNTARNCSDQKKPCDEGAPHRYVLSAAVPVPALTDAVDNASQNFSDNKGCERHEEQRYCGDLPHLEFPSAQQSLAMPGSSFHMLIV